MSKAPFEGVNETFAKLPTRMRLDGYLMMHANRSLAATPIRCELPDHEIEELAYDVNQLKQEPAVTALPRTKVYFGVGEYVRAPGELWLRATNTLNSNDTLYHIAVNDESTALQGLRFAIPKNTPLAPLTEADLHIVASELEHQEDISKNGRLLSSLFMTSNMLDAMYRF